MQSELKCLRQSIAALLKNNFLAKPCGLAPCLPFPYLQGNGTGVIKHGGVRQGADDCRVQRYAKESATQYHAIRRRLLACLRALSAVLGTSLTTVSNTLGIQSTTDDVVTDTRKVLYTAAANHNYRVLLQVVTFTGDVSGNFHLVGQLYTSYLTKRRVRLLRSHGLNRSADTALLRSGQVGGLLLLRIAYVSSLISYN